MTSEEARKRLDEILERMEADAKELNRLHLNHPFKVSTTFRDSKKILARWREIADTIVRKIKQNDQTK